MKTIYLMLFSCFCNIIFAQDVSFQYKNDKEVAEKEIQITKDTKRVTVKKEKSLKSFTLIVKNLDVKNKLLIQNEDGIAISPGVILHTDKEVQFTSTYELKNSIVRILLQDENGNKSVFASFLIEALPNSKFNIISKVPELLSVPSDICKPCKLTENALIYDFAKNKINYAFENKIEDTKFRFRKGLPKVGLPYSFTVSNINPFRDSVIISNQTMDFNTEVPELFNKAFYTITLQSENNNQPKLLADVFALGAQIENIKKVLIESNSCTDVCLIIQKTKTETEKYFVDEYKYNLKTNDLIALIAYDIADVVPLLRDSAINVLNNYRKFYMSQSYLTFNVPQIQNVDQYIFNVSVIPKSGAISSTFVDHQPLIVNTIGGIKVDFSSGLFLTNLRDKDYKLKPDSSVILNSFGGDSIVFNRRYEIVEQKDEFNLDFGVSALMHFYPRLSQYINPGLTLGAGLSIGPNPAIRYLGGASIIFGKSGRLIFSYGCAAGFVDRLADGYNSQLYISSDDVSSITKRVFKAKSFYAVTFNIPLFKSKINTSDSDDKDKEEDKKVDEEAKE